MLNQNKAETQTNDTLNKRNIRSRRTKIRQQKFNNKRNIRKKLALKL